MTAVELYRQLAERGLAPASQSAPDKPVWDANASPWYVQVLIGFSAWLAGGLLLGFIVGELWSSVHAGESWETLIVIGVISILAAMVLFWTLGAKSQFVTQFAMAISLAGQFALVFGIGEQSGVRAVCWAMLIVEALLVLIVKNRLHRLISTFGVVLAWAFAMHIMMFDDMPWSTYVLAPPQGWSLVVSILIWMVVWAPVAGTAIWLVIREASWTARGQEALLGPVMQGLIAALSIAPLVSHPSGFWFAVRLRSDGNIDAAWVALWPLLAVMLALLALALAFNLKSYALLGSAILFALAEVSAFYYAWGVTLLVKSIVMLILGGLLLLAARWSRRAAV